MNKDVTYEDYLLAKLCSTIIFYKKDIGLEISKITNDSEFNNEFQAFMSDVDILYYFSMIVDEYSKMGLINKQEKNNINNFLNNIRFLEKNNDDTVSKTRIKIINDIIIFLNSSSSDNNIIPIWFYEKQYIKRTCKKIKLSKYPLNYIEEFAEYINDSMFVDLLFLISHNDFVDDPEFNDKIIDYLALNKHYYETLNTFLTEYPEIFKEKRVYNNTMKVLNLSKEKNPSMNEYSDKFIKIMNKKKK